MATVLDRRTRGTKESLSAKSLVFQRGNRVRSLQKTRRRLILRFKHVLALLLLLVGFFLAFERAYLFLISWEKLTIKTVDVRCSRDSIRQTVVDSLGGRRLGNILLCDISALQSELQALPWTKDVRVQKVFPSSLRVEVIERVPVAMIMADGLYLVDEEGLRLERVTAREEWPFPLITDEKAFTVHFEEKWAAVEAVLGALPPEDKDNLLAIDCSESTRLRLRFKNDPVDFIVESSSAAEKLALFRSRRPEWESLVDNLASVDLRFPNRIILCPGEKGENDLDANSDKEVP